MRTLPRFLIPLALVLLAAAPASADWVLSGYFGSAATVRSWLTVSQANAATNVRFASVDFSSESFRSPVYYGYRVTYFPTTPGWFGVEAEMIHLKVFADTGAAAQASGTVAGVPASATMAINALVQRFSLSHGQNMVLFSAVARRVLAGSGTATDWKHARLTVVGRVGIGPTVPHVEATIGGVSDEHYQRASLGVQAAGGLELRVWGNLHALGEYKFTRCRQTVSAAGATLDTLLRTHHVAFGASWHF